MYGAEFPRVRLRNVRFQGLTARKGGGGIVSATGVEAAKTGGLAWGNGQITPCAISRLRPNDPRRDAL